jgi:hypothetical protein
MSENETGIHALAVTKNPQGKPVVRVSLKNNATVSAVIQGDDPTSLDAQKQAATAIAERVGEKHPEHSAGILEELHLRLERRATKIAEGPKPKAEKGTKKSKSKSKSDESVDDTSDDAE